MKSAKFWKFILTFFKIALAIAAILAPIMAAWDTNDPWPVSNEARLAYGDKYFFVPVGGSWQGGQRLAQTALLFPKTASSPKFVSIRKSEEGVTVHTDQHGFWLVLLYLTAGWYFAVSYSRRWLVGRSSDLSSAKNTKSQ